MIRRSLAWLVVLVACGPAAPRPEPKPPVAVAPAGPAGPARPADPAGPAGPTRPPADDEALLRLRQAIAQIDEANPRSVENALKAADAIGEARLAAGAPALAELAHRPVTKKLVAAQVAAIRALGKLGADPAPAIAALVQIVEREPPPHPRQAKDEDRRRVIERFELALVTAGAAINALAELRAEAAAGALVLAMYRFPELSTQLRRALVASGPGAAGELRKVLRGQHAAVNELFRAGKLDRYCGDHGDAPCRPVSAMDFYAAAAVGAFHDASAVPDLLAALKRPAAPAYFVDEQAGPSQHVAILDALRKIGSPDAAAPMRALWTDRKQDPGTRIGAIAAYPFVSRDGAAAGELGKIAADNAAEDELRQEAATAFARLARDPRSIATLQALAQRYLDASAKKLKEADRAKPRADAADKELEPSKQALDAAKAALLAMTKDPQATAAQIRAETAIAKRAEADFKAALEARREKIRPFKELDRAATAYLAYARTFQLHIARVEIALRCKEDLACYAASFRLTTDEAAAHVSPYIRDVFAWTVAEKRDLIAAAVERALLEIGKRGAKAEELTAVLLDRAATEDRLVRQSILLALPKIAKVPCAACVEKLDLAIKATEGTPALAELALETTLLRTYFAWAGTRK